MIHTKSFIHPLARLDASLPQITMKSNAMLKLSRFTSSLCGVVFALCQLVFGLGLQPTLAQSPGDLDTTFLNGMAGAGSTNGLSSIVTTALQPDGRILIAGSVSSFNGVACGGIARLNSDGSLDTTFMNGLTGFNKQITSVQVQPDGKIIVGGNMTSINGVSCHGLVRLNSDGTLDTTFPDFGESLFLFYNAQVVTLQLDGKILVGGSSSANGFSVMRLNRFNTDGSLDAGFVSDLPGQLGSVLAIALQSDGKLLVGLASSLTSPVFRLNSNGTLDPSFVSGFTAPSSNVGVNSIAIQTDGKVLIGCNNTVGIPGIGRLNSDGTLDTSFLAGMAGVTGTAGVFSIALQPDGKILVGGSFLNFNGVPRERFARLNTDGSLDLTFLPVSIPTTLRRNPLIRSVVLQPDGNVLIGGSFTSVNGVSRLNIARLIGDSPIQNHPPVANAGTDQSVAAGATGTATVTLNGTGSSDADGDALTYSWAGPFGTATGATPSVTLPMGVNTITLTVNDGKGGSSSDTVVITVVDVTPPTIVSFPPSVTVSAGADGLVAVPDLRGQVVAHDNVTPDSFLTILQSPFPLINTVGPGAYTMTLTVYDQAGNSAQCAITLNVVDTTPPALTVPANQVLEATSAAGAVATFSASATDAVTASPELTYSVASGSTFPLGTTIVDVTTSDAAGNTSTGSFTITVQDTTPPTLSLPADAVLEATGPDGVTATFTGSAEDIVSGALTVVFSPASGSTFALGTNTVTATATDASGNTTTGTFTVTVQDTTAPLLSLPANLVLEATGANGAIATFSGSGEDLVSGALAVTFIPASGSAFTLGTTTVTGTATDAAGNMASGSFTVTVRDTTPPVITSVSGNLIGEATSAAGAVVNYAAAVATDAVGVTSLTYSQASGSRFPIGATTVTITSRDAAGNTSTAAFTVTVRDATAPVLSLPANLVLEATRASGAVATFSGSAEDSVSGTLPVTFSVASGSTFALGTTTVTGTATDASGNTATGSFTVTVRDTTAPAITGVSGNLSVTATSAAGAVVNYAAATATDAVGVSSISYSKASGSSFPIGISTVTVTARDAAGNASTATFTVTVRSSTPPVITSVTPSTAALWPPNHKLVPIRVNAVATGNGGISSLKIIGVTSSEPDNGLGDGDTADDIQVTGDLTLNLRAERSGAGNGRTYTITVEAKDAAGNAVTQTCTVLVPKSQGK